MTKRIKESIELTPDEREKLESIASMEGIPTDQLLGHVAPKKVRTFAWKTMTASALITAMVCATIIIFYQSKATRLAEQNSELREIMGYSQMSTTLAKQSLIPKLMPHLAGKRDQAGRTGFYTFFILGRIPESKGFLDAAPQTLNVPRFVGKFDSTGGFRKEQSNGAHPIAMAITKGRYVAVNWLLDHLEDPATEISWDYKGHRNANGIHGALVMMLKQTPHDPELLALFDRVKKYLPAQES